ncbi:POU domain, class 5, transcription factor 1.1-like [Discoglossus pictus]
MSNFLGYPQHQPPVFHYPGIKPGYGEFDAQAGADGSGHLVPWNPLSPYDQTAAHGSGQANNSNMVNSRNIKHEQDSDEEEAREVKYPPAPYAMAGPPYPHPWNPNLWPGIPTNSTPSNYPLTSQHLPLHGAIQGPNIYPTALNQSPETPRENGTATMEGSHCTANSSPNDPCIDNTTINTLVIKEEDLSSEHGEVDPVVEREMKRFARELKQKRVQLGHTQADIGFILGSKYGKLLSQTTICRFESLQLSYKNMVQLRPILELWLAHADDTTDDLQDLMSRDPAVALPQTRKRKRRTNIDPTAKIALENYFARCRKPGAQEIVQLARDLNMDKDVVRVWFCNRRQKGKRQGNMSFSDENAGETYDVQANGGVYAMSQMGQPQGYSAQSMGTIPVYQMGYHANEMYHQAMPLGNHSV